jgi:hypothetical protein
MLRSPQAEYESPPPPTWEPVPLELPVDDPYRRPPTPAGGDPRPPADDEPPSRVIVIDLA